MNKLIPHLPMERRILIIRHQKVMLDRDLADLYGVTTKRLNEQVKRNIRRFPPDFVFQLTLEEKAEVVAICDHLQGLKFSHVLPYAFTEHGTVMLASVLNSSIAILASVQVVRAFIRLREMLASHRDLLQKLEELEKKYDSQFAEHADHIRSIFEAIQALLQKSEPADQNVLRSIGIHREKSRPRKTLQ